MERARAHHRHAGRQRVLQAQVALRDLADRVGRERPQRRVLAQGQVGLLHQAVLLGAAHGQHARLQAQRARALQQVQQPQHVRAQRSRGVLPGTLRRGLRRQVHHAVGTRLRHRLAHRRRVLQVGRDRLHLQLAHALAGPAVQAHDGDLRLVRPQVVHQVAPHEPGDAGDEKPHER
jgi:hypothetical protein